ncbi:MAG: feruloyl-CoA synthase [Burkholderiales bacterium]|nr:feruloyl-CoA synthase [Burkholderiales bacterium]
MSAVRYRPLHVGGCIAATQELRADGTMVLRSTEPLGPFPARLTDRLVQWATQVPDRCFAAKRHEGGEWRRISYAEMLQRVRAVGQALVDRGLGVERPVVILSDNDLEHLTLALGALWVGVPHVSISSAYSLVAQDYGKLRFILDKLQPGLVFAAQGGPFSRAIAAAVNPDVEIVVTQGAVEGRRVTPFASLLAAVPGPGGDAAHAAVGPDTIAKFMFTSGSTKHPKGVVITNRMWCSNQQMLLQCMAFLGDQPPVLVDWLPWNHTFGGNHNIGIVLYNGGTLYIDEGKPTPKGITETLRNLREITPTVYFNVPKGFEEIASAMGRDTALRDALFKGVQAFMCGGAGLSQAAWGAFDQLSEAAVGERPRLLAGLGMTETSPSCTFVVGTHAQAGHIGLPCPGVEVKLVPMGDKTEVRFRGPNVMPGYWREPELTAAAFDEEGFYRTGDAVTLWNPADFREGLRFDGRIAEDFKLSTGTFVSVGPLKAQVVSLGAPCVQDVVVAGINRDEIGALVFPRLDECRRLAGLDEHADAAQVLGHPAVLAFFQQLADTLWRAGTGSATRVARWHLMQEPPSIDRGEITDKGSINQRSVLTHRAALVEALYSGQGITVILPNQP